MSIGCRALCLVTAAGLASLSPAPMPASAHDYENVLSATERAADSGRIYRRYDACWAAYDKAPSPRAAFAEGVATTCLDNLISSSGVQLAPPRRGVRLEDARKALHWAMEQDPDNAYPIVVYAWYVHVNREPGLAPWITTDERVVETTVGGRKQLVHYDRVVADPAKTARVRQLLDKAEALDPNNPLLLYLRGIQAKDKSEKRALLWKSIGKPGSRLWEFFALGSLRQTAKGDSAELERIKERVRLAKAVVGDTLRAKANGF